MKQAIQLIYILTLMAVFSGCSHTEDRQTVVQVTASFRERLALLPGVRLEAQLLDISRQDAAATVISELCIDDVGNPPYRFVLPYDQEKIDNSHRYAVRVQLKKNEKLLFTTDRVYPVLTQGNATDVDVSLIKIARSTQRSDQR